MRTGVCWAAVVGLLLVAPLGAQETGEHLRPCGTPDSGVRAEVVEILTAPEHADNRAHMGLTGLAADDLVDLTGDEGHVPTCALLLATLPAGVRVQGAYPPMSATMFKVGDRYIVAIRARPIVEPSPMPRSADQTISYTLDFEPIGGVVR